MSDNKMEFPETFDEFAEYYGFKDTEEIYTNGSDLIPIFRVKQWLENEHCEDAVSRQSMLDAITEIDDNINMDIYTNEVREIIGALTSVTPTRKKGKWKEIKLKTGTVIALRCDCCEKSPKYAIRSLYCPNCGAEMESEE